MHCLYEQIKKEFSSIASQLPPFPPKKILPLSANQLEERRLYLEKYIQAGKMWCFVVIFALTLPVNDFFFVYVLVGQEPILSNSELFNGFLLTAQQETSGHVTENATLDVFLMNGYKISLNIQTNERSDQILEVRL